MGACAMVRMGGRNARGRGRGGTSYYPPAALSYASPPQPRFIYQTSPALAAATPGTAAASPQFYPTTPTAAYFDAASPKRPGEEQLQSVPTAALMEVPTAHPGALAVKAAKNSVQVLIVAKLLHPCSNVYKLDVMCF